MVHMAPVVLRLGNEEQISRINLLVYLSDIEVQVHETVDPVEDKAHVLSLHQGGRQGDANKMRLC